MEFSIGITPEGLWAWFGGIMKKFGLWLLGGWKWYLGVVCFIVLICFLYRLIDRFLFNKYRGKYENENSV